MKNLHFNDGYSSMRFDFINQHKDEIITLWQSNRPQRGFIGISIDDNYKPLSIKFIKSNVKESTFVKLNEGELYALAIFSWDKTNTISRCALGYKIDMSGISIN